MRKGLPTNLNYLVNIRPDFKSLEEHDSLLGLLKFLDLVSDDEWEFRRLIDDVSLGHDESRNSGGRNSRADGIPLLIDVGARVPLPVILCRGKHPSSSTHVSKRSLPGPMSTATTDTRDTCHGSTCTPRLSRCLMTWSNKTTNYFYFTPFQIRNLLLN